MISSKIPNPLVTIESKREKTENLEKPGNTKIWRPHGQKYRNRSGGNGTMRVTSVPMG